jgi:hypothetical protein
VAASLLFFGARGSQRRMWIPSLLLAASDVLLTRVVYAYAFTWDHFVTWAWYAAILWLGTTLRGNLQAGTSDRCGVGEFGFIFPGE